MEEKKQKETKGRKLTYEQLNEACNQLFQQNQYLAKQLREFNMTNSFKRLDYLFKVVDTYGRYAKGESVTFDPAFVEGCIKEIQDAMIPDAQEEPEKEGE